jgi:hypothetical protein
VACPDEAACAHTLWGTWDLGLTSCPLRSVA